LFCKTSDKQQEECSPCCEYRFAVSEYDCVKMASESKKWVRGTVAGSRRGD